MFNVVYQSLLALGGATCLGVGWFAWRNRSGRGEVFVVGVMAAVLCWTVTSSLIDLFSGTPTAQTVARLQAPTHALVPLFLLLAALQFTGNERYITTPTVGLLSLHPVFTALAAWLPGVRDRYMAFGSPTESTVLGMEATYVGYEVSYGPLFYVHTVYSYLLLTVAAVLFVSFAVDSDRFFRRQAGAVLVAIGAPWLGNVLFLFGGVGVDLAPIGFAVTGVVLWWGVSREALMDILPIARGTVVDNIGAGVFVLDRENRIVDANPAGRELLGFDDGSIVGHDVSPILAEIPGIDVAFPGQDDRGSDYQAETEVAFGGREYRVQVSLLSDRRGRYIGRLVLVQDVTEQKRRQRELERQNEQLAEFANIVSHDLRNPLNVAAGRLELARQTGDEEHFEHVARAHERMDDIIDEVLTLAREGQQVEDPDRVSVADVATAAWENVRTPAATLTVEADTTVQADRSRLQRALENLFRNAVEHGSTGPRSQAPDDAVEHGSTSPDSQARQDAVEHGSTGPRSEPPEDAVEHTGPNVTVTVGPTDDGFFVADDGPGIPPEERDAVFENGMTTSDDGTGFGLAIVARIVQAHDWEIEVVESDAGGARFEVHCARPDADTPVGGANGLERDGVAELG